MIFQRGVTPYCYFFRQGFTPHYRQGFTPHYRQGFTPHYNYRQGFTPPAYYAVTPLGFRFMSWFSSAGVHTTCLRCCHPFGVPFCVVVFHRQGFTLPAYDAVTPLGFRFASWFFIGRGSHHLPMMLSPLRGSFISSIPPQSNHSVSEQHLSTCSRPLGRAQAWCSSGSKFPQNRLRGRHGWWCSHS